MNGNTGEVREISLLDIMGGAVAERVNYEFDRVARNMLDQIGRASCRERV